MLVSAHTSSVGTLISRYYRDEVQSKVLRDQTTGLKRTRLPKMGVWQGGDTPVLTVIPGLRPFLGLLGT